MTVRVADFFAPILRVDDSFSVGIGGGLNTTLRCFLLTRSAYCFGSHGYSREIMRTESNGAASRVTAFVVDAGQVKISRHNLIGTWGPQATGFMNRQTIIELFLRIQRQVHEMLLSKGITPPKVLCRRITARGYVKWLGGCQRTWGSIMSTLSLGIRLFGLTMVGSLGEC